MLARFWLKIKFCRNTENSPEPAQPASTFLALLVESIWTVLALSLQNGYVALNNQSTPIPPSKQIELSSPDWLRYLLHFFSNSYFVGKTRTAQQIIHPQTKEENSLNDDLTWRLYTLQCSQQTYVQPTVFFIAIDFSHAMKPLGICNDYV